MATKNSEYSECKQNAYDKIEQLIYEKLYGLENENAQLRSELITAKAKLEVYERIATITGSKGSLGFGPLVREEK